MQRLISYNYHGLRQWGILSADGNYIYSASDMEEIYFIPLAGTLDEFIACGEDGLLNLSEIVELEKNNHALPPIPISEVEITTPYQPKRNIFCVGKNYRAHVAEFENDATAKNPATPVFFTKATTSVIGPNESIDSHPEITSQVDYEGELAVIIGKQGCNIPEEDASQHIYGYTIINDVTARDLQKSHEQWFKGKSLDTFCPIGPTILVGHRSMSFTIHTKINQVLRQEGSTSDLIFSIPKIISILSEGITLLPGDIIATGTPQGVGMGLNPPAFLQKGDVVEITIDPIGTLKNIVK